MNNSATDKLNNFFSQYKSRTFAKGDLIVRDGETPESIFYIKSGIVKMYTISDNGEEVILNVFKKNSFFPFSNVVTGERNIYYYEAIHDVDVYMAPKTAALNFIKNDSEILFDLLSRIYRGTDGLFTRMTFLMAGSARERLVTEIIIAARRFGTKENDSISVPISAKDLSFQTGLTKETVSREMKKLKDEKLIIYESRQIEVKNMSRLAAIIQME